MNDVRRQNHAIAVEIEAAVRAVLDRGWYILGPEVDAFEREFAAYCGAAECVSVGNGTDAIELVLRGLGIGTGDSVGTVANAGMYATTAILQIGATPVFVEVDSKTMVMTAETLRAAGPMKAAVVTHLYGRMADMPGLLQCGVPLIEDCAQAHGARLQDRMAGTWGVAGAFSFYPTKNLGALGDGGAVITQDPDLATRLRRLRQYGWASRYVSEVRGGRNSRLDEMQAAVLRVKLRHLDKWNERRRAIAGHYDAAFGRQLQNEPSFVGHLYVIRSARREELRAKFAERGIPTDIHYPVPDHRQPSIGVDVSVPVTERLCREVVTLPLYPHMTDSEVEMVAEAARETQAVWDESLLI